MVMLLLFFIFNYRILKLLGLLFFFFRLPKLRKLIMEDLYELVRNDLQHTLLSRGGSKL